MYEISQFICCRLSGPAPRAFPYEKTHGLFSLYCSFPRYSGSPMQRKENIGIIPYAKAGVNVPPPGTKNGRPTDFLPDGCELVLGKMPRRSAAQGNILLLVPGQRLMEILGLEIGPEPVHQQIPRNLWHFSHSPPAPPRLCDHNA